MTQWLFRLVACALVMTSLGTLGCSSQLSEEETPVVASDEDEPTGTAITNDPENP